MQDQRVWHWSNSAQFLSVVVVQDFELVGQANRHDVVVDLFTDQELVVKGGAPDGDFEHSGTQNAQVNVASC